VKNFASSLTMWGAALLAALQVAETSGAVPPGSGEAITSLGQAIGLILVVVGRWRASTPLTLGPSK
jgi:hypothetical protein